MADNTIAFSMAELEGTLAFLAEVTMKKLLDNRHEVSAIEEECREPHMVKRVYDTKYY